MSKFEIGTTPPSNTDKLFFNTSNNTLNFYNPSTKQWEKCCGAYADDIDFTPTVKYPIDEHTKLLLHGYELSDSSNHKIPVTSKGVTVSTAQSKFGGKSLYFNGSSHIEIPQSTIVFGANDFTIEWWEYAQAMSGKNGARFSSNYSANGYGGLLIGYNQSQVYAGTKTSTWDILNGQSMLNTLANQWVHRAIVRYNGQLKSYTNGMLYSSVAMNGAIMTATGANMAVGGYNTIDPSFFTGYINEFRIVDQAVYKDSFIPKQQPYYTTDITQ